MRQAREGFQEGRGTQLMEMLLGPAVEVFPVPVSGAFLGSGCLFCMVLREYLGFKCMVSTRHKWLLHLVQCTPGSNQLGGAACGLIRRLVLFLAGPSSSSPRRISAVHGFA